jgi:hypothetical protein
MKKPKKHPQMTEEQKNKEQVTENLKNAVLDYLMKFNTEDLLGEISSNLPTEDAYNWAKALENELSYHASGCVLVKVQTVKQQMQLEEVLKEVFPSYNEQKSQCELLY